MTAVNMAVVADRIRAEIVGRGFVPTPEVDASATETVRLFHAKGAADAYLAVRLCKVLRQLESGVGLKGGGPATPDVALDARIALGEYETYLHLTLAADA